MSALARKHVEEHDPRLWTADQFLEFYMTRPDEERWQLVDGLPAMMVPPTYPHQRIARNLFRLLDRAIERKRPDLLTVYELGVRIPGVADFNPTPDLLVLPANARYQRYADTFLFTGEVTSPSNTLEMIERKLELYRSHPDNLYCLQVGQDEVHIESYAREDGWKRVDLRSLDDVLKLPAFGFAEKLADIYEGALTGD
jgi:Uma2 family endonuclease